MPSDVLSNAERFRLRFGPYRAPRFKYGSVVQCAVRGEVVIVGLSAGRIPWPIGQRRGTSARGMIVYAGLARAVQRESGIAVAHWWGVTSQTVTIWRKALDVGPTTEGTSQLRSEWADTEPIRGGLAKAVGKARDPNRRQKIAASRKGKPRTGRVLQILARGRKKCNSPAARAKRSATAKRNGIIPPAAGVPWTAEEDGFVKSLPATEAAKRTGRTLSAVYSRRHVLGVEGGRVRGDRRPGQ